MSNQPKKKGLSKAFVWFHATSVNGGAMAIAATIASYFTLYVQEEIGYLIYLYFMGCDQRSDDGCHL